MSLDLVPAVAEVRAEVPKKNVTNESFVFFAGDTIAPQLKFAIPFIRFGGTLRIDTSQCLKYRGGYIRQCEITQLRIHWQSEHIHNVNPNERKHLAPVYELTEDSQTRTIGIDPKTKAHDGLLRFPFFPSMEVEILTSRGDGLVKMPCSTPKEALLAQKFLFPNWGAIFIGEETLPEKTVALKRHFEQRKRETDSDFEQKIANAAILSCEQYLDWCNRTATVANAEYVRMQTAGRAWAMGTDAEAAFLNSAIQRRDTIQQNQQDQFDKMSEAITTMANTFSTNKQNPAVQSPIAEDAEYQEYLQWKAWKAQHEAQAQPVTPEGFGQCKAKTIKGERCKSPALENGFCANPSHQSQMQSEVAA